DGSRVAPFSTAWRLRWNGTDAGAGRPRRSSGPGAASGSRVRNRRAVRFPGHSFYACAAMPYRSDQRGLPITQAMRMRARELGVAALERLDHYGMEDRREAAFNLLLGATAPLLGMTGLGWPPKTVMFSLLIN